MRRDAAQTIVVRGKDEISDEPILYMLSFNDVLEAYKPNGIFELKTPDAIDPERSIDDPPWVVRQIYWCGTKSPLVARTCIQAHLLLQSSPTKQKLDKDEILKCCRMFMGELLDAQQSAYEVISAFDKAAVESGDFIKEHATKRVITNLPQISGLEPLCKAFLNSCRRSLNHITPLFSAFNLLEVKAGKFDSALKWCEANLGCDHDLTVMLESDQSWIKTLIKYRNAIEHSQDIKLEIRNIHLTKDRMLYGPSWRIVEQDICGEFSDIINDVNVYFENIFELFEDLFIILLRDCLIETFPVAIFETLEDQRDEQCPVRFSVGIKSRD